MGRSVCRRRRDASGMRGTGVVHGLQPWDRRHESIEFLGDRFLQVRAQRVRHRVLDQARPHSPAPRPAASHPPGTLGPTQGRAGAGTIRARTADRPRHRAVRAGRLRIVLRVAASSSVCATGRRHPSDRRFDEVPSGTWLPRRGVPRGPVDGSAAGARPRTRSRVRPNTDRRGFAVCSGRWLRGARATVRVQASRSTAVRGKAWDVVTASPRLRTVPVCPGVTSVGRSWPGKPFGSHAGRDFATPECRGCMSRLSTARCRPRGVRSDVGAAPPLRAAETREPYTEPFEPVTPHTIASTRNCTTHWPIPVPR